VYDAFRGGIYRATVIFDFGRGWIKWKHHFILRDGRSKRIIRKQDRLGKFLSYYYCQSNLIRIIVNDTAIITKAIIQIHFEDLKIIVAVVDIPEEV